jgi:hypothetical protein
MSRSGYSDSCEGWALIRWRGAVTSAIKGARGQAFLREMIAALDAMPEKTLIESDLQTETGEVCAMGAVGLKRGIDMVKVDPEDAEQVAETFGISPALAKEISYENDECGWGRDTPEDRWKRMHDWAEKHLVLP